MQGIAKLAGMMQRERWDGMGMSRDVEAKYCLLPCRMRPEKQPELETVGQEAEL